VGEVLLTPDCLLRPVQATLSGWQQLKMVRSTPVTHRTMAMQVCQCGGGVQFAASNS
jgi:hypothetical protein